MKCWMLPAARILSDGWFECVKSINRLNVSRRCIGGVGKKEKAKRIEYNDGSQKCTKKGEEKERKRRYILTNVPVLSGWALARRIESLTCHSCSSTFLSIGLQPVADGWCSFEAPTKSLGGSLWFLVLREFKKGALRNVPDADQASVPFTPAHSYPSTVGWASTVQYGALLLMKCSLSTMSRRLAHLASQPPMGTNIYTSEFSSVLYTVQNVRSIATARGKMGVEEKKTKDEG